MLFLRYISDLVIGVLHPSVRGNSSHSNNHTRGNLRRETSEKQSKGQTEQQRLTSEGSVLEEIDYVPSNAEQAGRTALMNLFEDNKAVIKVVIRGPNPTTRHASRTHRVALAWLFDQNQP